MIGHSETIKITTPIKWGRITVIVSKSVSISKQMVWLAYQKVKANSGSAGIDGESIKDLEENLRKNLYKLWNRLASGSYFPPMVKEVEIPKGDGRKRKLGIPTVADRIAQTVVKDYLEERFERIFDLDSYGYRPNRSGHQAIEKARKNCWKMDWVIDLDIKSFFDEIDQELLSKALSRHVREKWVMMYIQRWLEAPIQTKDGEVRYREGKGTPQGGVISPLLSNLYLHYAMDYWLKKHYPDVKFERYADDIIIHCQDESTARKLLKAIENRLEESRLRLNPEKTRIVYCKDNRRRTKNEKVQFDFLGYRFQPRTSKDKAGRLYLSYDCGISPKKRKKIEEEIRAKKIHRWTTATIEEIAKELNPQIRGWINYYGKFRKWEMAGIFWRLNRRLARWAKNKYKSFKGRINKARKWLILLIKGNRKLFVHWEHNFIGIG